MGEATVFMLLAVLVAGLVVAVAAAGSKGDKRTPRARMNEWRVGAEPLDGGEVQFYLYRGLAGIEMERRALFPVVPHTADEEEFLRRRLEAERLASFLNAE